VIGGELDENWSVTGSAKQINNHSATIEAQGDLYIATNELNNINDHIVTEMRKSDEPPEREEYFEHEGSLEKYSPDDVYYRIQVFYFHQYGLAKPKSYGCEKGGRRCYYKWNDIPEQFRETGIIERIKVNGKSYRNSNHYKIVKTKYQTTVLETDPGNITAAGNVIIHGQTLNNQDSKIIAGKTVNINVDQLNNHSQEAIAKYVYSGKRIEHWKKHTDDYRKTEHEYTKPDEIFIDNALNKNIVDHQIFEKTKLTEQPRSEVNVENKHNQVAVDKTVNDTLTQQAKVVSGQSIAINSNQSDRTHIKTDANHQPGSITSMLPKPTTTIEEDLPHQEN
ncbi:hypothetical protein, partial [Gilliamella sp. N-G2]